MLSSTSSVYEKELNFKSRHEKLGSSKMTRLKK